jgi:hypothetical protein
MDMTEEREEPLKNKYPARKHKNDSQNKEAHFLGFNLEAEYYCGPPEVKALLFIKDHELYIVSQFWT